MKLYIQLTAAAAAGGPHTHVAAEIIDLEALLVLAAEAEIDFGAVPVDAKTFTMPVTGALLTHKVMALPSLSASTGVDEDEFEAEPWACVARPVADGSIKIFAYAVRPHGRLMGKRKLTLMMR